MNNKDLLKEGFFSDNFGGKKKKPSFPEYTPVDKNNPYGRGIGSVDTRNVKELKKRLEGGLGALIGNNTVTSMANRAIKKFPIVISENVDPNTAVMLKNYLEQQYAEYINILVSNQVIDITDYSRNNAEGNIAIQALDKITGTDFSKQRLANKAMNNSLSADDIFANNPTYRLLKQESFTCGDPALDSLLEDAMIVDSKYANKAIELMEAKYMDPQYDKFDGTDYDSITTTDKYNLANVNNPFITGTDSNIKDSGHSKYSRAQNQYLRATDANRINKLKDYGFVDLDSNGFEKYDEFSNGEIVVDKALLSSAINREIGDVLNDPKNAILKQRYIDATYLLYSHYISGREFLDYITKRLGIPVRDTVASSIVTNYKEKDLIEFGDYNGYNAISDEEKDDVKHNKKMIKKYTENILSVKVADVLKYSAVGVTIGTGAGGAAAAAIGLGSSLSLAACASLVPFIGPIIGGTALTGGLIGWIVSKLKKKKSVSTSNFNYSSSRIKPWEKVEAMIDKMEEQRNSVIAKYTNITNKTDKDKVDEKVKELKDDLDAFTRDMKSIFESGFIGFEDKLGVVYKPLNEEDLMINTDVREALSECINENRQVNEAYDRISLIKPSEIIKARREMGVNIVNYDPDNTMMLPSYGARSQQAYGSVEYDRRELKDRRFNTPLILTVKFKERYSDGKYSDNELTAVIGILGVITRIPSEEMEYILKANAEGSTIKGIFAGDDKGSISDIIAAFKKNRIDSSKLPQSGEVWKNLEKVSQLAIANKLAGKSSNNIANAHIIFSQKEADTVRQELGIDYLRDRKLSASLMKRYSAMNLMVANDALERVFVFNDVDAMSWDVIPYDALRNKDSSELATLKNLLR